MEVMSDFYTQRENELSVAIWAPNYDHNRTIYTSLHKEPAMDPAAALQCSLSEGSHFLISLPKKPGKRAQRKRCTGCYRRLIAEGKSVTVARKIATKVNQQCNNCEKGVSVCRQKFRHNLSGLTASFTQSMRGKPLIVFNNYTYCRHSVRNGIIRWTCSTHSYKCCKAIVKTSGSHIIEVKGFHNHDASELLINRGKTGYDLSLSERIVVKNADMIF
ncbi:hypothetical protein RR48_05203 [Papilio machaon]|uniref:FLYWCH-type domain-containing protein n=1 Tax=Papilio machaon TaxID=76193 RepID=A0A0N0PC91_PAPMA|nr:hypothetical protein RR48_05203 [Papilio machaon]